MKKRCCSLFLAVLMGIVLAGCYRSTPPDVSDVQEQLDRNISSIQIVVDFMKNSGYNNIYINDTNGIMNADLSDIEITDPTVTAAIAQLLGDSQYYSISKRGNTIEFLQWTAFIRDLGCGIAYTISGVDPPEIYAATKMIPLSNAGWFYYVSDYEQWRREQGTGSVS